MNRSTRNLTELAPIVVERVARRVSRRHRRAGQAMLITAALSAAGFLLLLIAAPEAWLGGAMFFAASMYMYGRRRTTWRAADRIAEAAAIRRDLDWTYSGAVIQAHDRKGPRPTLALAATPSRAEIEGDLPSARLLVRETDE